jgi:hypothetical protein
MANEFGKSDAPVNASEPQPGPKGWYTFNNTLNDSSGQGCNGQPFNIDGIGGAAPSYNSGKFGNSLNMDGSYGVSITESRNPFSTVSDAVTVSMWIKGDNTIEDIFRSAMLHATSSSDPNQPVIFILAHPITGEIKFTTGIDQTDKVILPVSNPEEDPNDHYWDQWNHYAFVKDGLTGTQTIYVNGCEKIYKKGCHASLAGIGSASIGATRNTFRDKFIGWVDDYRIYNYALSQAEIADVMGQSTLNCKLISPANLDTGGSPQIIDFRDYKKMADEWLENSLWP